VAIDPKDLDDVRPAMSVVDRLKTRKNRIKPWQISPANSSPIEETPASRYPLIKAGDVLVETDATSPISSERPANTTSTMRRLSKKIDNNSATSREHLDNKSASDSVTSREHLDNNSISKDQTKKAEKPLLDNNSISKRITTSVTSREHLDNNSISKCSVFELTGLQKKLVDLIFSECLKTGSLISPHLTNEYIRNAIKASVGTTKTTLSRVVDKGILIRRPGKYCRGGWVVLEIPTDVYQDLVQKHLGNNTVTSRGHLDNNSVSIQVTEQITSLSSSSRDLILNEESTTTQPIMDLSPIDLGRVQHLGITTSVLARCVELYPSLQPEQLEGLVFRFAEFAKDPKNKVQNARGFFISLAEQASKGQVPLDHIETPDERLMRLFVEQQEATKTRRIDFERKAQEFECETWLELLTPEIKRILVPETAILKAGTAAYSAMLKSHFAEHVWPERRRQILESATVSP